MKRAVLFFFVSILVVTGLVGCGKAKDIDMTALTRDLLAADIFDDMIKETGRENTVSLFGLSGDEFDDAVVCVSTLVTPEEIAIFKAKDADQAKIIADAVNTRVELQTNSYKSYAPEQVPKLDNALVKTSGLYVIYVCASDAAKALEIVDGYLK